MPQVQQVTLDFSRRREEGDWAIYPDSLLFKAGDYPDKKFKMTPEELLGVVGSFTGPVTGNIEHTNFLAGKAGEIRSLRVGSDEPGVLRGEVAIPLWLDKGLGSDAPERGLSCEWHPETKALEGFCLTASPRVTEAALMSWFAGAPKHTTYEGQSIIQSIHDQCGRAGAVCDPENSEKDARSVFPYFHSKSEMGAIQKMHDHAVEHGARCSVRTTKMASAPSPRKGKMKINFAKYLPAWMSAGSPAEFEIDEETGEPKTKAATPPAAPAPVAPAPVAVSAPAPAPASFTNDPAYVAMQKQLETLQAENVAVKAASFADSMIRMGHALPNERATMLVQFTQAAMDDARSPGKVTFSKGGQMVEGTRVDLLNESYASRPKNRLTEEWVSFNKDLHTTLQNGENTDPYADDEKKAREFAARMNGRPKVTT